MFLGDAFRNFEVDPLTQDEIQKAIEVYSREIKDPDIQEELRTLYSLCLIELKKHLFIH